MLTLNEIHEEMQKLKEWSLEFNMIAKNYTFGNFKRALEFVNKVGEIAERLNHHPDITLSYSRVRLSLTTHYEKGLTVKDFEVAKEIDKITS